MVASRSRSPADRSPRHRGSIALSEGHRCSVWLSEGQYEQIQRTHVLPRAWFGYRQDCVLVNTSVPMAVAAWQQDHPVSSNRVEVPPFVLTFTLSLRRFHRWIDSETMEKCDPRVGGYRIYQDVNLAEVDPQYFVYRYWGYWLGPGGNQLPIYRPPGEATPQPPIGWREVAD